ncbi:hypothetical protein HDV05_005072 [Chytridiales sp. JEL 0842]|nr:hypothetical protein HDV05_005072 [Chytridiales sp. JEL 0842]
MSSIPAPIRPVSGTSDVFRHRNKRKDDAIRKKVETETASNRLSTSSSENRPQSRKSHAKSNTVSSLRPAPAITVLESARIVQAAQLMAAKRADAVLAVNEDGQLSGILTDKDIAYRVVAEGLDVRATTVAQVMTRSPISVHDKGNRNEALGIMVARKFRHLPVISSAEELESDLNEDNGSEVASSVHTSGGGVSGGGTNVVGLLDITKCVFERLDDLEKKVNEDANIVAAMEALERRGTVGSDHVDVIKSQHGCPDLQTVLAKNKTQELVPEVSVKASVRDAAKIMREYHSTGVLVLSAGEGEDRLGGIFTTKDVVLRVIAAGLDPNVTSVVRVMTPHPDSVTSDTTILDALKKLHIGHYLHLPVVDNRLPVGLVDVLTLTMAMLEYLLTKDGANPTAGDADSGPMWNKFWNSTFAPAAPTTSMVETESDAHSVTSGDNKSITSAGAFQQQQLQQQHPQFHQSYIPQSPYNPTSPPPPQRIASYPSYQNMPHPPHPSSVYDDTTSSIITSSVLQPGADPTRFTFKTADPVTGQMHRFHSSSTSFQELLANVQRKTRGSIDLSGGVWYEDDEGDLVQICSDADLQEAVEMARQGGWGRLKIVLAGPGAAPAAEGSVYGGRGVAVPVGGEMVAQQQQQVVLQQQQPLTVIEFLKEAPLSVNVALSAGVVVVAAFVVSKLQRM